jgi:hypothetical protein
MTIGSPASCIGRGQGWGAVFAGAILQTEFNAHLNLTARNDWQFWRRDEPKGGTNQCRAMPQIAEEYLFYERA